MENYKGTIWATWDASAPAVREYLGGYKLYLDLLLDRLDGREGGTEAIGGIHKWLIPATGSSRPRTSRATATRREPPLGRHGRDRFRAARGAATCQERNESRWLDVSFPELVTR